MNVPLQLPYSQIADQLARLVLNQVDRTLALMDRDPSSPTFGSMDRTFWYYRTLTNFPGASWQQPMVALAALYRTDHAANRWHGNRTILRAAEAALRAWTAAQHSNGAFDEWYKNEHAYCPTAITAAGAAMAIEILGDAIDPDIRRRALNALERSGEWLRNRYNPAVMNQNLAACVGLAGLAVLTGQERWRDAAQRLLARIAADQNAEGWFPEYQGFDFGYSTLALDFLALSGDLGLSEQCDPLAARLVKHLLSVTEEDRPVPGRLGSRGTSHIFPYGAIRYAGRLDGGGILLRRFVGLHDRGMAAGPANVDDRYLAYFYMPAFCLAYQAASELAKDPTRHLSVERPDAELSLEQPGSGLIIRRDEASSLYVSRRLGGGVALAHNEGPPLYHLGYTVMAADGRRYSSAHWRADAVLDHRDGDEIRITSPFVAVSGGQPLKHLMIPFQIVIHVLVLGRVAEAFQGLIKRLMVAPKKSFAMTLERRIRFSSGRVTIKDRLVLPKGGTVVHDFWVTPAVTMHSPSARQDAGQTLELADSVRAAALDCLRADGAASLICSISEGRQASAIGLDEGSDASCG